MNKKSPLSARNVTVNKLIDKRRSIRNRSITIDGNCSSSEEEHYEEEDYDDNEIILESSKPIRLSLNEYKKLYPDLPLREESVIKTFKPTTDISTDNVKIESKSQTKKLINSCYSAVAVFICILLYFICNISNIKIENNSPVDFNILKSLFPNQPLDIWDSIEVGLSDVNRFNRPAVFMFLYNNDTKTDTDNIINKIAKLATQNLTNSKDFHPIVLSESTFKDKRMIKDYGVLISDYKSQLEEKHVMVVKNLQNVPGSVALAFHTYCDEYTPLVGKSLFLFSVDVTGMEGHDMEVVENVLREKWMDLKEDLFAPLFVRISSTVLKVSPERGSNLLSKDL